MQVCGVTDSKPIIIGLPNEHFLISTNQKLYMIEGSSGLRYYISAPQSKNAVSTNIKHSRYSHLMSNFRPIHFHTKRLYVHMLDISLSYRRGLIVC